jgi:CBS domain-containing protein
MTLRTICNREVVIVGKNDAVSEVAKLMRDYHVGTVVAVEEHDGRRYPVGILTDRDIVIELLAKDVDIHSVTAGDVMSREIASANENDGIIDTIRLMRQKGIRRLPVTGDDGALVGIVTVDDLLDIIAEQLQYLAALIGKQQSFEKKHRD